MAAIPVSFLRQSRHYLTGEYLPKIAICLEGLREEDVWWRPNPASNSVGNLLLHLAGNVRQWIVAGVGGAADHRRRQLEFDATGGATKTDLLDVLAAAVKDADAVLARLEPAALEERRLIQGREVTVFEAVYHVVEHFAMHTGQIAYVTKQLTGTDLELYDLVDGIPRARWGAEVGIARDARDTARSTDC